MCICTPDNPEFSITVLKHHLKKKKLFYEHAILIYSLDLTSTFVTTIVTLDFFWVAIAKNALGCKCHN